MFKDKDKFKWENVSESVSRAKVPGGWLVKAEEKIFEKDPQDIFGMKNNFFSTPLSIGVGLTFYPDPNHEWDGSTLP